MSRLSDKPPVAVARNGKVVFNIRSVQQAKAGLQELRAEQQMYTLVQRQVASMMTAIRTEYNRDVAGAESPGYRGQRVQRRLGYGFAVVRDPIWRQKSHQLGRLEMQRLFLEDVLHNIDQAIMRLEQYIDRHDAR